MRDEARTHTGGLSAAESAAGGSPGVFLAFEGGEGSGKSTQVALLADRLRSRGRTVTTVREPGGTEVGEAIRALLLHREEVEIPARTELLLLLAARAALVERVLAPALTRGDVVVADRFDLSTLAYQGYGRGLPLEEVRRANRVAVGTVTPDLYLVLDLGVDEGRARQRVGGKHPDRIEREDESFLSRVGAGYLELARTEPRVCRIDARGTPEEVQVRIVATLEGRLPETFPASSG